MGHQPELHTNASMLSYILLSGLLLSVQAQNCTVREIIRFTNHLLEEGSLSCPCRGTAASSCSCLPIPEPGHELPCFVEGTDYMLRNNFTSNTLLEWLNLTFQIQLDRNLCESLARGDQCQYKSKGNVKEFLGKILTAYQGINKSKDYKKLFKNSKTLQ
ncbi:interleukin-9 [Indicator indicator]|uniref:interleukin-9 n=1 Tax=Indicator indicator TaxID=1002788 RepID=UPI0023DF2992|nr:interleukin-9 [Indicator indicator]